MIPEPYKNCTVNCEHECSGRLQEPHPGHLWPGELARMDAPEDGDE